MIDKRDRTTVAILALCVVAGVLAFLFVPAPHLPKGPLAVRRVDQVMAAPERWLDTEVKLHGYVEQGSLAHHTFVLAERQRRIAVRYGVAPDTLAERAEVVARGRVTREHDGYVFVATEVMAKCPSTYNTADGPKPAALFR